MTNKAYCLLCCLLLSLISGLNAQEKEDVKENVVVTEKVEFIYDAANLKAEVDKADADKKSGERTATVKGAIAKKYSNGATGAEEVAYFTQTKDKDGNYSAVSVKDGNFFTTSNVFMMFCACLVFIMHLGFATLETGLTRAKNTVNILFKNVSIVAIATIVYAIIGFNLMYPGSWLSGEWLPAFVVGLDSSGGMSPSYNIGYTYWTDFLFQAMFAAATASVVSGAVCERIKLSAFLIFCTVFAGLVYPILGAAHWGAGFLSKGDIAFQDLAGSTLVHSVGGWGALAGALILGPRIGKYVKGKSNAIMGHNMPLATVGCMLLWFGWFGFNAGSQLNADPEMTSQIMVSTLLSSCAGVVGAMVTSWIIQKKPDLSMILNGALAGLVGITAGAHIITGLNAVLVGVIAGVLVVFAVLTVDKLKIDDPVGAVSVHLVCGIWGTLACALFWNVPETAVSLGVQIKGILYYALAFPAALVIFFILKVTIGIRVSEEEEIGGLDVGEHGMEAYNSFQIFSNM